MGRVKAVPTKNKASENSVLQPIDYIPVHKRKSKRKTKNPSYPVISPELHQHQFYLGDLCVGVTKNRLPESWSTCRATFLPPNEEEDEEGNLMLEFGSFTVLIKPMVDLEFLKDVISTKVFAITVSIENEEVQFKLYFMVLPLLKYTKRIGSCIQTIFSLLYDISHTCVEKSSSTKHWSSSNKIEEMYQNLRLIKEGELDLGKKSMQHAQLHPTLRPYQEDAVRWMLHREQQILSKQEVLHPMYTPVTLKSGLEIYYNKYTGYIELVKPLVPESSNGGILADEMGLGKTVEVLACILQHPKVSTSKFSIDEPGPSHLDDKSPTIMKISKRRKRLENGQEVESDLVDGPKKLKIRDDWVKSSSKKTATRVALESWYESCLAEVSKKPTSYTVKLPSIQCVCGNTAEQNNSVICVDCGKQQHSDCLGYKGVEIHGAYRCPQCWINQPLIEVGATLIVFPISLRTQWCCEISMRIRGGLKVLDYCGSAPIYPTELLQYDIVTTTYSVLQSQFRLTENDKVFGLRNQKRYAQQGSSLTRVNWWRLCLDEAQAVEAPSSVVSAMAQKLSAHFRWAVTGTPISKEISDLYGLIEYLHIAPYNDDLTWKHILLDPYNQGNVTPMYKFLSQVMWRTSKNDVIDQIAGPKPTIKEHWLTFSQVEYFFYKCLHDDNRSKFLTKARSHNLDAPIETFDRSTLKMILDPLISLRHVCTCPNSSKTRYLITKKPVTSMKDLLAALIAKNTSESEEYLRVLISSVNGLAGIYLLLHFPSLAVDEYRKVLQLHTRFTQEEKVAKLNVDKLQVIHAMHNLAEVLTTTKAEVGRTLRDEELLNDCNKIEQKHIGKFINQSMCALQDCLLTANTVEKLQKSFVLKAGQWYCDMLDWIRMCDHNQELSTRIMNAHTTANVESTIDLFRERSMLYSIATWDESIGKLREEAIEIVNDLFTHCPDNEFKIVIDQELVQKVSDCHLRPQKTNTKNKKCSVCGANDFLKKYELKLFSMTQRTTAFEDMSLKGSWKPTSEELIFRCILALGKAKHAKPELIKDGEVHVQLLDTLKKEFKEVRKLWTFVDQQICALDELDMCKMRLRINEGPEKTDKTKIKSILQNLNYTLESKLETIHLLNEHELDYQRAQLQNEEFVNNARLEKNLGIRNYLETLRNQQCEEQSVDPCPICKNALENHWCILPCGHSYCLGCIQSLAEQTLGHHIVCSVCRAVYLSTEISYITPDAKISDDALNIRGDYSTKIEAVVKLLLQLKKEDEKVKVLLFSTWEPVLLYLKDALTNNDITTELVQNSNLDRKIEKFKDPKLNVTALLLPINKGSKGLNLIEATHVVLIEPLIDPRDELQAIGRIHRIGQTKPTFVHKFFIKNTIEESIYKAMSGNTDNWENTKVTLRQLTDLFSVAEEST